MQIAKFKKEGPPVFAEVKSGYAQPGTYALTLWQAGSNKIIMKKEGNFMNTEDDKYEMPPNKDNNNRIISVFITLVITPPINDYNVELEITQGGNVIGKDSQTGSSSDTTKTFKLLVQLQEDN